MRVDCGAGAKRLFPAVLQRGYKCGAHGVRDVGVDAAHARDFMAETSFLQDFGDSVLFHPCLVTVPQAVRG